MVLQVPPELPLGLVFVVGQVHNLNDSREEELSMQFDLVESGYHLRCQITSRLADDLIVQEGDMVRAGGHLAFDTQAARYFLLARDLEIVLETAEAQTKRAAIMADINQRAEAAKLVRTDLPHWVKQLAPPEVQEELGLAERQDIAEEEVSAAKDSREVDANILIPQASMSDEMLSFLSEAIDRQDDVEITPEILAQFIPLQAQPESVEKTPAGSETRDLPPPASTRPLPETTTDLAPANQSLAVQADAHTSPSPPPAEKLLPPEQAPALPPSTQPRQRSRDTAQNLLLVVIGILLLLLVIVVSLLLLNYFQII